MENSTCPFVTSAWSFVDNLQLSEEAATLRELVLSGEDRFECEGCGRETRLYCVRCLQTSLPLPPPLSLGLHVTVIRHTKEPVAKSSTTPLPLLSPSDICVLPWEADAELDAAHHPAFCDNGPGTWLVFPKDGAVDAEDMDWREVRHLVVIDSRWQHAGRLAGHPKLASLPAVTFQGGPKTCFWRSITEKRAGAVENLISSAECVHHLLKVRASSLQAAGASEHYLGDFERLDDLLVLFGLRLRIILEQYRRGGMGKTASSSCCPWCKEADRREQVHQGNARTLGKPTKQRESNALEKTTA